MKRVLERLCAWGYITICTIGWLLCLLIGWLKIDNYQRQKYFKEGYDRALKHAGNYYRAFGKLPSQDWADKHWNYTNTEDGWISKP